MMPISKKIVSRFSRSENGQILFLALMFMILGSIIIVPLLTLMATGLRNNRVFDDKTAMIYAADAGVEDAKWKIQYDQLDYSPYDFYHPYPYTISQDQEVGVDVNQYPVDVSIQNVWIPKDIQAPTEAEANEIINTARLVIVGTTSVPGSITVDDPDSSDPADTLKISQYTVKIIYTHGEEAMTDLKINTIGIWLPKGFAYFRDPSQTYDPDGDGSGERFQSQLEDLGTGNEDFETTPESYALCGNEVWVWDYAVPQPLYNFPDCIITKENDVTTLEFSFFFRSLDPDRPAAKPDAVTWVETSGVTDVSYSWNADIRVYQIQSTARDVTTPARNVSVTSYLSKSELRAMGSSVAGDYYATGNTLISNAHSDPEHIRDTWLNTDHSSSAAVTDASVGESADNPTEIAKAYLYWTGWKNREAMTNLFSDDCSDLNEWQTSSSDFQTRIPTADADTSGTWNPGSCWDEVNETSANDGDYMTGTAGANTGWLSPTANAADTGGDGNGFEVNPTGAYADGGGNASNINGAGDRHSYHGYDTSGIPAGSSITGIEVRLDWWIDSADGYSNNIFAYLSWDGGAHWASASQTSGEPTTETTTNLGSPTSTWGHNWTISGLNSTNFRVRLYCDSDRNERDFFLDWVPVRISYTTSASQGQKLFGFSHFSVPAGTPVHNLTVYYRSEDEYSGTNNIRSAIKVGGTIYSNVDLGTNPDNTWNGNTFSYSYATNPATGAVWTAEDIDGTGDHALQSFGVYSSDFDPGVRVSMVYARVDYGFDSLWSVSTNRFQGRGAASANNLQRTLTMRSTLDLSSYGSGTVSISWSQSESGTLEANDYLYYALSGDGGVTWSADVEAFCDDNPPASFSIDVPDEYLTPSFKMRFYFTFDASDEYVYLDNIGVSTELYSEDCSSYTDNNPWELSATGSRWSISGNTKFLGTGATIASEDQRTIALHDSIDLSGYDPGLVWVNWEQTVDHLEADDQLFFAFYSDELGWSSNIEALHGNNTNRFFCWQVPSEYLTDSFRIRFYFDFNAGDEHVYLDNINLSVMAPDKSVYFQINGQQVYFDGYQPAAGGYEIVASGSEIIPGIISGEFYGYSYACFKDVTALVNKFTVVDEGEVTEHSPGVATYTVGHVDASVGIDDGSSESQMSHAGWSLILVYTSLQTSGHQLYLFDRFSLADDYTDLDFDRDGKPGGDISGFIVPERIQNEDGTWEENVAKLTAFVGEGDDWIEGDFIAFQAPDSSNPANIPDTYKLWDGVDIDSTSNRNNVWNGQSTVFNADGIDVDTFYVPWEDGGLEQGDSSAHIDIYTEQDNWNLVYLIISFRSKVTYGGSLSYLLDD